MVIWLLLQQPPPVTGDAAFSYRIESTAEVRGMDLAGREGCAVLDCSLLGEEVWVFVGDSVVGPLLVVDCTAAHHREFWHRRNRAVDLPWSLWDELGLPLAPVPAVVAFEKPRAMEWY